MVVGGLRMKLMKQKKIAVVKKRMDQLEEIENYYYQSHNQWHHWQVVTNHVESTLSEIISFHFTTNIRTCGSQGAAIKLFLWVQLGREA